MASKLEKRILIGKLTDTDIEKKPLAELRTVMGEHEKADSLTNIYDETVKVLNESTASERVDQALMKVAEEKADTSVGVSENEHEVEKTS